MLQKQPKKLLLLTAVQPLDIHFYLTFFYIFLHFLHESLLGICTFIVINCATKQLLNWLQRNIGKLFTKTRLNRILQKIM